MNAEFVGFEIIICHHTVLQVPVLRLQIVMLRIVHLHISMTLLHLTPKFFFAVIFSIQRASLLIRITFTVCKLFGLVNVYYKRLERCRAVAMTWKALSTNKEKDFLLCSSIFMYLLDYYIQF